MTYLPPLNPENVQRILEMLLDEASKPMDEPYDNQWNKHRLAYIRQSLRCVDLWIEHERYNAIESRLDRLDGFVSDIKMGMFSPEAAEWIRSKNGIQ